MEPGAGKERQPMNTREAFQALGVRDDTLTPAEKEQIDRDGFVTVLGDGPA